MANTSIADQLKTGKLTHLMELLQYMVTDYENGYACALCELQIIAKNLRHARKIAEFTYGKCPGIGNTINVTIIRRKI